MRIVIPTYRRMERQLTLAAIPPELHGDVTLVVRPDEASIGSLYPNVEVAVLPESVVDLCGTRQWIWEKFTGCRFVMIDDDVEAFERKMPDGLLKRITSRKDFEEMLRMLEVELDAGAGVVTIRNHWTPPQPSGRVVSAANAVIFFMFDMDVLRSLGLRWDRIKFVNDLDFVLQVLSHGIDVVGLQDWSFKAPSLGEGDGGENEGFSWGDRARLGKEALAKLGLMWPEHVVLSTRKKGGYTIYRRALLKAARERKNGGRSSIDTAHCPICLSEQPDSYRCKRCGDVIEICDDPEALARIAKHLKKLRDPQDVDVRKHRGRPSLGNNHPVILKMVDRGQFRAEDVSELYANRGSANAALANLARRGQLTKVGIGLYEVVKKT